MSSKSALPVVATLLAVLAQPAWASELSVLKEEMVLARKELVTMVLHADKRGPDQQKRVKDTADAVSAHFARMTPPPGRAAEFRDLRETWEAFKRTRETELVPAILAGEKEKAGKIASGIQKERLDRCYTIIAEIDK